MELCSESKSRSYSDTPQPSSKPSAYGRDSFHITQKKQRHQQATASTVVGCILLFAVFTMTLVDLDNIPTEDETPRPFLIFEHLFQAPAAVAPLTTTPPHPPSVDAPLTTAATPPPPVAEPGGTQQDETSKDEPPTDDQGPRFKDQVHPDYVGPDLLAEAIEEGKEEEPEEEPAGTIPIASALLVPDSQIKLEDRVQLELEREQHELERQQRQQLEDQLEQQAVSKKRWIRAIIVAAVGLAAGVAAFLSICGTSGNCRGSDSKGTSPTSTRSVSEKRSITAFVNNITLSNQTLRYPSNATAEERALSWLIDVDLATTESNTLSLRQRYALATLWFQTLTGFGSSGWATGITECGWNRVDCDDEGRLVTRLDLFDFVVGGQIPADLGLLTDLTHLRLSDNALNGAIPSSLGILTALTFLDLSYNELTGIIPSSLGSLTALTRLWLDNNALTGTIPSSIASLTDLYYLDLSDSVLTGTIPTTIGSLTALISLDLSENGLTGTIPSSIASLTDLSFLFFYNNGLTGTMPFCDSVSNQSFLLLVADCDELSCPCCTGCCPTSRDGIPVSVLC